MASTTVVETTGANGQLLTVKVTGANNVTIEKVECHIERKIEDRLMMTVRPQKRKIEGEETY